MEAGFTIAHPLSDALTMYCLSLHALALDRQVMEAVWPNSIALGQIWPGNIREEQSVWWEEEEEKQIE